MADPADDDRKFRRLNVVVLAVLAVEILVLWLITKAYE